MSVAALFYGQVKHSNVGDMSLALYESLLGFIPVYILAKLVKEHKPEELKHDFEKLDENIMNHLKTVRSRSVSGTDGTASLVPAVSGSNSVVSMRTPSTSDKDYIDGQFPDIDVAIGPQFADEPDYIDLRYRKLSQSIRQRSVTDANNLNSDSDTDHDADDKDKGQKKKRKKKKGKANESDDSGDDKGSVLLGIDKDDPDEEALDEVNVDTEMEKWEIVNELKEHVIKNEFRYPAWCKTVFNIIVVLYVFICCVIVIIWCLFFDLVFTARNNYQTFY